VIAQIEVGDEKIRVFSDEMAFAAAANAGNACAANVPDFLFSILFGAGGPGEI